MLLAQYDILYKSVWTGTHLGLFIVCFNMNKTIVLVANFAVLVCIEDLQMCVHPLGGGEGMIVEMICTPPTTPSALGLGKFAGWGD